MYSGSAVEVDVVVMVMDFRSFCRMYLMEELLLMYLVYGLVLCFDLCYDDLLRDLD